MAEEGMQTTPNKLIHIGVPIPFDKEQFIRQLTNLADAAYNNDEEIIEKVEAVVPTFHHVKN